MNETSKYIYETNYSLIFDEHDEEVIEDADVT